MGNIFSHSTIKLISLQKKIFYIMYAKKHNTSLDEEFNKCKDRLKNILETLITIRLIYPVRYCTNSILTLQKIKLKDIVDFRKFVLNSTTSDKYKDILLIHRNNVNIIFDPLVLREFNRIYKKIKKLKTKEIILFMK